MESSVKFDKTAIQDLPWYRAIAERSSMFYPPHRWRNRGALYMTLWRINCLAFDGKCNEKLDVETSVESMGLLPVTQNCGCACAGNAGNVFPVTAGERSRHASRHVRHVPWCMPGSLTNGFLLKSAAGEKFPAFPAHAQPAILRIW